MNYSLNQSQNFGSGNFGPNDSRMNRSMRSGNRAFETKVEQLLHEDFQEVESNRQDRSRKYQNFATYEREKNQKRGMNNAAIMEIRERSLMERKREMREESAKRIRQN